MSFKQGNNPLSRKTSPMRMSPFKKQEPSMSMDELQKMSAAQDAASKAQADKLPQIEKPGFDYEMDQDMSYPGGERGRDYDEEGAKEQIKKEAQIGSKMGQLKDGMSRKESPLNAEGDRKNHKMSNNEYSEHLQSPKGKKDHGAGMSRKEAKYFGLGKDDGTARKTKKADKTAKQVIKMQNKRSSVKNVYLGDPDDLEGEMVRTADKPASKREKRKVKKLAKTKQQLSPLNSKFSDVGKDLPTTARSKGSIVEKATPKSKEESIADGDKKADKASKSVSDFKSKINKQAADTKGKATAKDRGKVDKSGREGSNKQERQKRRAERKSIRKDKTLSSSQKTMAKQESRKKQKENVRGVKK